MTHPANQTVLKTALTDSVALQKSPRAASASDTAQTTSARPHEIDIRLSLPWFNGRHYIRILTGPERRTPQRLHTEGQTGLARISIFYGVILFLFFASAMFGAAIFLYLVKSMLGINIFESHSMLHQFFY